ncbi:hypothetical protein AX15_004248 [Amanita polypyramis BW_CC]|nr:hypothetical protein AX15_004248 [Amanita polypyramis BW_CC]
MWDLSSKSLLATFQYPQPISVLAWDRTERLFFATSPDGSIHQTNLFRKRQETHGLEAVGGSGVTDAIRIDNAICEAQKKRLISIHEQVTSMAFSLTSTLLLVGTMTGLIHVVDIPTHQQLRTISTHKGLSITHLQTMLKPLDLMGHVDLGHFVAHGNDPRENIPVQPVSAFQRLKDTKAREAHNVSLMLPPAEQPLTKHPTYPADKLLRDQSFFIRSTNMSGASIDDSAALKTRVATLETEVQQLKAQLGRAKGINDAMWDNVVQRIVLNGKTTQTREHVESEEDNEHRRKRTKADIQ